MTFNVASIVHLRRRCVSLHTSSGLPPDTCIRQPLDEAPPEALVTD